MGIQRFEVQFWAIFFVFRNESISWAEWAINKVASIFVVSNEFI